LRNKSISSVPSEWITWLALLCLAIGGAILFAQWNASAVYWPTILAGILLLSGLASITDYLLNRGYRSLFMGVLMTLLSLFIWGHLFLYPSVPFWNNSYWFGYLFLAIGFSYFLFVVDSGERGFAWIAFLCIGIALVHWLLQNQWTNDLQWISYLAISLVFLGFLIIGFHRTSAKKK